MNTIIDIETLASHLNDSDWIILDARFSLADEHAGRHAYEESHIPGAIYVDLNKQLSQAHIPGKTGRHPLPDPAQWAETVQMLGIDPNKQVVVYDAAGGAMASRAWWLLRWIGHDNVAVLNGGWQQWQARQQPLSNAPAQSALPAEHRYNTSDLQLDTLDASQLLENDNLLIDARELPRFRGEIEPIDPVAGHIPNAVCMPFNENLDENGCFKDAHSLRSKFEQVTAGKSQVVCYCGSGVTACHNILAMKIAGLPEPALYPGSWSEWITDPKRPIATGE